jgi:hypothetical protein
VVLSSEIGYGVRKIDVEREYFEGRYSEESLKV